MSDLALRLRHVSLFVCRGDLVYTPAMCFTRKVLQRRAHVKGQGAVKRRLLAIRPGIPSSTEAIRATKVRSRRKHDPFLQDAS